RLDAQVELPGRHRRARRRLTHETQPLLMCRRGPRAEALSCIRPPFLVSTDLAEDTCVPRRRTGRPAAVGAKTGQRPADPTHLMCLPVCRVYDLARSSDP